MLDNEFEPDRSTLFIAKMLVMRVVRYLRSTSICPNPWHNLNCSPVGTRDWRGAGFTRGPAVPHGPRGGGGAVTCIFLRGGAGAGL